MNTNQPTTETPQSRAEFIRGLGLSSAALMSFYCMGTLTSCSSSSDPAPAVTPTTPTTPTTPAATGITGNAEIAKGKIDFTLDLTSTTYSKLKTVGEFVKVGDVLVANAKGGKFVGIQRLCTHAAFDTIEYRLASDDFTCTTHSSGFGTDGSVKAGPATRAMKAYKTTLSANGNSLQVAE